MIKLKDESSQWSRRTAKKKKKAVKEDEKGSSRWKELEKLAAEAEKEAERECKARKMVEIREAPARWLKIREALRNEKEQRLKMKRRKIKIEEMNNPKVVVPPPPPHAHQQPLQTSKTTTITLTHLLHQSSQASQVTWPRDNDDDDTPRTLQLFPEVPTPDPPHNIAAARDHHRASSSTRVAVAVTKINGEMLTGFVNRLHSFNELVICCDCHCRMFTPEGFLNHAGRRLQLSEDPFKYIVMLN